MYALDFLRRYWREMAYGLMGFCGFLMGALLLEYAAYALPRLMAVLAASIDNSIY